MVAAVSGWRIVVVFIPWTISIPYDNKSWRESRNDTAGYLSLSPTHAGGALAASRR